MSRLLKLTLIASSTWLSLAVPAVLAQRGTPADDSDVRIVSSFVAPGEPVPQSCARQAHDFAESLVRYPRPLSWHWVLICDESGWRRFLRLSGRGGDEPIYASTDLEGRTTYLRGVRLFGRNDFGVDGNEVVSHELAHILLNSRNERSAADLAHSWLKGGLPLEATRGTPGIGGN